MAKKKMTKAQAAAARHEPTANSIARKKAHEDNQVMNEVRRQAQKKAGKSTGLMIVLPIVVILVVIVIGFAAVMALGGFLG